MKYIIIVIILALTSCSDKIYNTTIEGSRDTVMTIELSGGYTTYQAMDTVKYYFDNVVKFYNKHYYSVATDSLPYTVYTDSLIYKGIGLVEYQYNDINIQIKMADGSQRKGSIIKVRATSK